GLLLPWPRPPERAPRRTPLGVWLLLPVRAVWLGADLDFRQSQLDRQHDVGGLLVREPPHQQDVAQRPQRVVVALAVARAEPLLATRLEGPVDLRAQGSVRGGDGLGGGDDGGVERGPRVLVEV